MRLLRLRSAWGLAGLRSGDRRRLFDKLRIAGWDGVEGSLHDIGGNREERMQCVTAAADQGCSLVLSAYSSWHSYEGAYQARSVHAHAAALESELQEIAELHATAAPLSPIIRINAHSGTDEWTESEAVDYFGAVEASAQRHGDALPPISHETHRGRYLCCPFATARLTQQVPSLRLTTVFSHWEVKCERLLDTWEEQSLLESAIAPSVDHIHARIGTRQAPQVGHPADRAVAPSAARHYDWWRTCWSAREAASFSSRDAVLTATIEYGPVEMDASSKEYLGYTPVDRDGEPAWRLDHEELLRASRDALDAQFQEWHSDSQRMAGW